MSDVTLIPDFQVYSGALEVLKGVHPLFPTLESTEDMPILPAIASSTEKDLQEDTMAITALQDMCNVPIGQSVFMNHVYSLPDSFFGKTVASPIIVQSNGVADLHTAYGVCIKESEAAQKVYNQIANFGARHGVSGGFLITQYSYEGDADDWWAPIIIEHILKVEDSIVGIPANQRSWVEHAIQGLFERCIREDNGEEAIRLAPAYKGLFYNDYKELAKSLRSEGLRKDIEARPVRSLKGHDKTRLCWEPLKNHFVFQQGSRSRVVERQEIPDILKSFRNTQQEDTTMSTTVKAEELPEPPEPVTLPEEVVEASEQSEEKQEETTEVVETEERGEQPATGEEKQQEPMGPTVDPVRFFQLTQLNRLGYDLFGESWTALSMTVTEGNGFRVKEGRAISAENMKSLKVAHDALATVGGTEVCSNTPNNDGNDNEDDGVDSGDGSTKSFEPILLAVEAQTKAVGDLIEAVKTHQSLEASVKAVAESLELYNKEIAALNLKQAKAVKDVNALADSVQVLKDMPMGDPRNLRRSIVQDQGTVDLKDMLAVNNSTESLEEALQRTTTATKTLGDGTLLQFRVWPVGVGKGIADEVEGGVRPPLANSQKRFMSPSMWLAYNAGLEASVPITPGDDPVEMLARLQVAR